jgi:type II secretory ATPase GspE/PulE/Tfp pilus assembly ATPase PilB-like protein
MSLLLELVKNNVIQNEQLDAVKNEINNGRSLDEVLVNDFEVPAHKIFEIKREYYPDIPVIDIDHEIKRDEEFLAHIPVDTVDRFHIVPIEISEDGLFEVGMLNPEDLSAQTTLQFIATDLGIPYRKNLISYDDYVYIRGLYDGAKNELNKALGEYGLEESAKLTGNDVTEQIIKDDGPIAKIVKSVIEYAAEHNASDIHVETHEK